MTQTIRLYPVDATNIDAVLELKVMKEQETFVASTAKSLAYAYAFKEFTTPYAIYSDKQLVGYLSVIFDVEEQLYTLWHFLIDKTYQGQGYGKQALTEILRLIKHKTNRKSDSLALTVEEENLSARNLYESTGFYNTNQRDEDEELIYMYDF